MKEEDTGGYKAIGLIFLVLAFIVLLNAFIMRGVESLRGARLVLIIFGVTLTLLGGFISLQKRRVKK